MATPVKLYNHPDYAELLKKFITYQDLFDGEHDVMTSEEYLPAYNLERVGSQTVELLGEKVPVGNSSDLLRTRRRLSRYTNFPEKALRRYKSIIFKNDPDIQEVEDADIFPDPWNVDGDNNNLIDWIKNRVFEQRFIYGDVYALVAGYQDEEAQYLKLIPATDVIDWQMNNGDLTLFRYVYKVARPRISSREEPVVDTFSDEYFIEGEKVSINRYQMVEKSKENEWNFLGTIPVDAHKKIPVASIKGNSFLKPAVPEILTYHNLKSSLLNQLYHQGTQKIFITGNVDDKTVLAMNETTATILRSADGNAVGVTVIEPTQPTMLYQSLNDTESNVYKAFFHMTRTLSATTDVAESDLTIDKQKEDLLNVIKSEILELNRFCDTMIEIYLVAIGSSKKDLSIQFDSDITVQDLDFVLRDELAYLEEIKKVPEWYKEHLNRVVKRQNYPVEQETLILKAIETNPPSATNPLSAIGFNLNNV